MKVALLQVGKTSEKYLNEGISSYAERIKRYVPFETITIPDIRNTRNMPAIEQKAKEAEKIMQVLKEDDLVVVLDEKGKELSTIDFSTWLEKNMMIRQKRLVFIIGGPWGVSDTVLQRADHKFSLSQMTFSHQIVRLLFLEQLYRAFTVIRGEPYHHI